MNKDLLNLDIDLDVNTKVTEDMGDILNESLSNATEENFSKVAIPGGDSEKPSSKPHDENSISIPAGTEISAAAYNQAITTLQKSFKEGFELLDNLLNNVTVIPESAIEAQQDAYTESMIEEAIFESYVEGPIFEAVQKENKQEIKTVAKKIRKTVCGLKRGLKWYSSKNEKAAGNRMALLEPTILAKTSGDLKLFSWQAICILIPARGATIGNTLKDLNEEFKDDLGDYEIKAVKTSLILRALVAGGLAPKEVTDEDKEKKSSILKVYYIIVDSKDSKVSKDVKVELDEGTSQKIQKFVNEANSKKKDFKESIEFDIED